MTWLTGPKNDYDIILLQETHYGLGKTATEYKIPGWSVISSPDPQHRWAGVAIYVSEKLACHSEIRFQELVPGRLLHVRIPLGNNNQRTHLDIINFYQWAWDNDVRKQRLEKRQLVWQRLERLLTGLPRRNVRCIAGDFNCTLQPDGVQVGPGTYRASGRGAYPDSQEFQQALTTGSMCALNTWGPRRRAATYLDPKKEHSSQIDFVLLEHDHVDPTARLCRTVPGIDFSPWREGGKHQALAADFGVPAFYAKAPMPQPRGLCRSTLREALRKNTPQAHAFEASLQTALSQASLGTASELTRVVYDCCAANFPARAAPKALQAWQTPESRLEVKHL